MLFIRNDQCCSKLFSSTEQIGFSCSRNKEQSCATSPVLKGEAGEDGLHSKARPLPISHIRLSCPLTCSDSSSNLAFQDFSIGGVVLFSFGLLKVFVCRLDPT